MKDILLLTKVELQKYSKQKIVLIGLILVFLIMGTFTVIEWNDIREYNNNLEYQKEFLSWQEREQNIVDFGTDSLNEPYFEKLELEQTRRRISIAQYRLDHNIPLDIYKNLWWFFNDDNSNWVFRLIIVLVVVAGCANIAGEYSNKTIGQLLILPYQRWKILTSKYFAMLLYGLFLFSLVFVLGLVSGVLIHGFNGLDAKVLLHDGSTIRKMGMTAYSLIIVALKLVELLFYTSLTVLLAVLLRSATVSTIVGTLSALLATPLCIFISNYNPIFNYSPFNNLDFRRYLDFGTMMPSINSEFKSVVIEGITPMLSAAIVFGWILLFIGITYYTFHKRDV